MIKYVSCHLFQLILHMHSLCTMTYTKHRMTGKHTESFQLEVRLNDAQFLYRFVCYQKRNLADIQAKCLKQSTRKRHTKFSTEHSHCLQKLGWGRKEGHHKVVTFVPASASQYGSKLQVVPILRQ